jgi:hypothetical protein
VGTLDAVGRVVAGLSVVAFTMRAMSTPQYLPPDAVGGAAPASPPAHPDAPAPVPGYAPPSVSGTPASQPAAPGYTPPSATPRTAPAAAASGYTPPSATPHAPTTTAASGYAPPSAAPHAGPAPAASGYAPPSMGSAPAAHPPVEKPRPVAPMPDPAVPTASEPGPAPSGPRIPPLLLIGGAIVALAVVGVVVAWLLGAFSPKLSHLPARVGTYALDASTQKSTSTLFDSATYRAAAGDIYQASIVKNAPDPAVAFSRASSDTRFQRGNIYCTGVSKTGKGGTCSVLLPTGSAATVEGSTKHTAVDLAQFTQDLASAIK